MRTLIHLALALTLAGMLLAPAPGRAADLDVHSLQKQIESLLATVKDLQARVAVLEAMKPTFTGFMPEFSERFHVMHRAGDAGDWAVANHEVMELQRLVAVAKALDPQKGQLMEAFMGEPLHELGEAIEHGNAKAFNGLLAQTVKQCNACHVAVHSPFIQIGLDTDEMVTFRHSHKFTPSKAPVMHKH